jgi:hypothetical protein
VLSNYLKLRTQGGPQWLDLLRWPFFCYLACAVLMALAALRVDLPWWAILSIGFTLGAAWVRLATARAARRVWPTVAEVLDWQRVERLLDEDLEFRDS